MPAIEVKDLAKRYPGTKGKGRGQKGDGGFVDALRGVSFTVEPGQLFALLGPNGAGKTTLLSILTTLRVPTGGSARVLGFDVVRERDRVRERIGVVFQEPAVDVKLSCLDNMILMGILYGLSFPDARRRAREVMERLDLARFEGRTPRELSGGQRRRLELGRALVPMPELLFLDEATLGLDVDARRSFWGTVRELVAHGHTVLFTTHYMDEADVADRIVMIDRGDVVARGTPAELKAEVGGGVILLQTDDDQAATRWLEAEGRRPLAGSGGRGIVLHEAEPASVLPELLKRLPVKVQRVEVREASLEDAFVKLTGKALKEARP